MGESAQLSFAPKISGEFLLIWTKFPQISKFFGSTMDEIRPPETYFREILEIEKFLESDENLGKYTFKI
jgi:hypothetical protein